MSEKTEKKSGGLLGTLLEFVVIIVIALGLAWGITHYVAMPYQIPSGSMEDTIQIGDRVLSEKISYYGDGSPEVGQIVTFVDVNDPDRVLIKRVIALGGQTVELRDGIVYIDGVAEVGDYIRISPLTGEPEKSYGEGFLQEGTVYTVPEGCIWCMGDNRENSGDSRDFGPVPLENVTGHAFFRYWPLSDIGTLN